MRTRRPPRPSMLVLAVLGACGASAAHADEFQFGYFGSLIDGMGTLSGLANGDGTFDITSGEMYVTEGLGGGAFTLFVNPGGTNPSYSPSGFFIYDNQVAPGSTDQVVNWYGLLFRNADGTEINVYREGAAGSYTFYAHGASGDVVDHGAFTIETISTPEARPGEPPDLPAPGAAALLVMGGAIAAKRKRA